jgi:hypothetical protein
MIHMDDAAMVFILAAIGAMALVVPHVASLVMRKRRGR